MINSGMEINFTRDGEIYDISSVESFDKEGRHALSIADSVSDPIFKFPFYNLVQTSPFRVVIYNEVATTLGAYHYVDREMAKTWITLARIYDSLIRLGVSIPERISYTPYYVPSIFYVSDKDVDYLFFTEYVDGNGNKKNYLTGSPYLIYYPIIFKKCNSGYYSICPPSSFNKIIEVDTMTPFYDRGDGFVVYRITLKTSTVQGLPIFELSSNAYVPNIIPNKFNLDRW